jgi:hypothetical protein
VQLGPKPAVPAKGVHYVAPADPYGEVKIQDIDQTWKNENNGNTISYRSQCNDPSDPSIDSIFQGMLDGLQSVNVENSQKSTFNGREALNAVVDGKLDGVETRFEVLIFKKNHCSYTLSYVALPKNFKADQPVFKSFVKSFEAP